MKNKIDVVITMGGIGSRFRKAGYTVPKYMIEARGKTLFEWSLISLEGYATDVGQYIFIAMEDDTVDSKAFIEEKCRQLRLEPYHIIMLDHLTDGQATTAMQAERYWNPEHGLLIYNIDTYVESGEMKSADLRGDGFIPCFQGEGNHWSFVRLDESGNVVEIKEKKRISTHCTIGAYYFRTCQLYKELYEEYYGTTETPMRGEKYVAPLYDHLLARQGKIYISDVNSEKVHVLGTPEELDIFMKL